MFRTWTTINQNILKNRDGRFARQWYLLRANHNVGWVYVDEFMRLAMDELGLGEKAAANLLQDGSGTWWVQLTEDVFRITGYKTVAEHYGCGLGLAVDLPLGSLESLGTFSAYLYASWFARDTWRSFGIEGTKAVPRGGKTISIKTQCELFGVSKSTILRWQKLAGVKTETQYRYVKNVTEDTYIPENVRPVWFDMTGNGERELVLQMPNRISSPKLPEAFRKMYQSRKVGLNECLFTGAKTTQKQRLYYDNPSVSKLGAIIYKFTRPSGVRIFETI